MSFDCHASRPRGSMAKAKDSKPPSARKSGRGALSWYSLANSASERTRFANGSIVTRPHIQASPSKLACSSSYSRCTAAATEDGQPLTTMRPSIDAAMWQITRGRALADGIASVLLLTHLLHPIDVLAIERFLDGDVRHRRRRRRAVPVLLVRWKPYDVSGPDLVDGATGALHPTEAGGDDQRLTQGMGMPRCSGTGLECDARCTDSRGRLRLK